MPQAQAAEASHTRLSEATKTVNRRFPICFPSNALLLLPIGRRIWRIIDLAIVGRSRLEMGVDLPIIGRFKLCPHIT
jgi:hypothetical protein